VNKHRACSFDIDKSLIRVRLTVTSELFDPYSTPNISSCPTRAGTDIANDNDSDNET